MGSSPTSGTNFVREAKLGGRDMLVRIVQTVTAAMLALLLFNVMPRLEGWVFPVITDIQIVSMGHDVKVSGATFVSGTYAKMRDCQFRDIKWHLGKIDSGSVVVRTELLIDPVDRTPGGVYDFDMRIFVSPFIAANNSFIAVQHNCHGPWLWDTITYFSLGDDIKIPEVVR